MLGFVSGGCAVLLLAWSATVCAQTVTIRGKVSALKDQDLIVAIPTGEVKATLTDQTVVRAEQPIKFSEIVSGMYLGTTATKQADGNFLASEVHVFSEDQRGTGKVTVPLDRRLRAVRR